MSKKIEAGPPDETLERLAQHFEAGGGADDLTAQRRDLGRRLLEWSTEAESFLTTEPAGPTVIAACLDGEDWREQLRLEKSDLFSAPGLQ